MPHSLRWAMVGFTEPAIDVADETRVKTLIDKAVCTSVLEREEILALLRANTWQAENLFSAADQVRMETVGDTIHLRGIVEFSNFCGRNCLYCGMRVGNALIERYRIPADEVVRICESMRNLGLEAVLLESGEDPTYTAEAPVMWSGPSGSTAGGVALGRRQAGGRAQALKEAGADKYLLKRLRIPGFTNDFIPRWRLDGLEPPHLPGTGQTIHSLVEDLLLFQGYEVDMAVIGPYIPASGTPMELEGGTWLLHHTLARSVSDKKHTVAEFVLKLLALTRLLLPETSIPSTTALASFLPQGREMGLMAGANMVMLNFTPARYKELFRVYDDRISIRETAEDALAAEGSRREAGKESVERRRPVTAEVERKPALFWSLKQTLPDFVDNQGAMKTAHIALLNCTLETPAGSRLHVQTSNCVVSFLVCLPVLLLFTACQGKGAGGRGAAGADSLSGRGKSNGDAIPVEVATAAKRNVSSYVTASSTLEAERIAQLLAETTGRVTAIHREEGDAVGKGRVLIQLEDTQQRLNFQKTKIDLEVAEKEWRRAEELEKKGIVSAKDMDEARLRFEAAKHAKAVAEYELQKTAIAAPFAGIMTERYVNIGGR
jgi:biotin synthase